MCCFVFVLVSPFYCGCVFGLVYIDRVCLLCKFVLAIVVASVFFVLTVFAVVLKLCY